MDIRQLRYFVAIVDSKSFSKASQSLHVAQPALSLHVRNMEVDLGADLLRRTPQGVFPTEAGQVLLERARKILGDFEQIKTDLQTQNIEPAGEVRLGLPGTIGDALSVPLILETSRLFPKVRLRISEAMSGFVLEWLMAGRVDLGLLYVSVEDRGMMSAPILTEELRLFGPADGLAGFDLPKSADLSLKKLVGLPLILPSASHGLRQLIDDTMEKQSLELNAIVEVDSYPAMKELVRQRLGFSILPYNAIKQDLASGAFKSWRLGSPPLVRTIHLVSQRRPGARATQVVEELCRSILLSRIEPGK
jgi:LysR family transcriptional regulator, nitrogen assimilation regulatory protein